jgi:histidinol-phosphatase (PHP family)
VIEAALDTGTILEINTAGLRNSAGEQYPSQEFMALLAQAGLPVVISSDAHRPSDVGRDFERTLAMARTAGFQQTARFQGRQRLLVPL